MSGRLKLRSLGLSRFLVALMTSFISDCFAKQVLFKSVLSRTSGTRQEKSKLFHAKGGNAVTYDKAKQTSIRQVKKIAKKNPKTRRKTQKRQSTILHKKTRLH